jgi:transmembrane sensor
MVILLAALAGSAVDRTAQAYYFDLNLSTEAGERTHHVLPDNSVAYLGVNSRIKVDFTSTQRIVLLERGEARFQVEHDPARPFIVRAPSGEEVKAVGTDFAVALRGNSQISVTVSEGKVIVRPSERARGGALGAMPEVPVGANQQVMVTGSGITPPRVVDAVREMQWMKPYVTIKQETLGRVVAEYNLRNRLKLVIEDPWVEANLIPFWQGKMDDPKSFVDFVTLFGIGPIIAERVGPNMILLKRNPDVGPPRSYPMSQPQRQR